MNTSTKNARRGGPVSVPILPPELPQHRHPIRRGIAIALLRVLGWRFEGDLPNLPKAIGIGAPHTSGWDVVIGVAAFWALDLKVAWMAKSTLFKWPYGAFFRWLGAFPIDRKKTIGVVDQVIARFDASDKMVLALAPEGTRKKVTKWKTGFYHIADAAKVPIVRVGIDFGQQRVLFGEPFYTTGDIDADMAQIKAWFGQVEGKHPHLA